MSRSLFHATPCLALLSMGFVCALASAPSARAEMVAGYYLADKEPLDHPSQDPEVRRRLEEADKKLEAEELRWQVEKLRWAQEKARLQLELETATLRTQNKTLTKFEQEMEQAKKKAQDDNRRAEELEKKEQERRKESVAERERNFKHAKNSEPSRNRARSATASSGDTGGSIEIGGLDRSSSGSSRSGPSYSAEGGRSSSSVRVDTTVIRLDQ